MHIQFHFKLQSGDDFWSSFEHFLGYKFPNEIKEILNRNGFDTEIALSQMNTEFLKLVEAQESKQLPFSFLPGHRALLLGLPNKIKEFNAWLLKHASQNKTPMQCLLDLPNITFIMKELIKTAINNSEVNPQRRRFSDAIKNFGIYLYMMCGKAAYEIISNNIPLPQPSTICKS